MKRHILSATTLALFCGLAMGSDTSETSGTLLPNQLSSGTLSYLENNGLLDSGENIRVYYDYTISMDDSESAWVSDQRVAYHSAPNTTYMLLSDIASVDSREEGLMGTMIDVRSESGELMHIEIAPMNGGDTFVSELEYAWSNAE
jgi:hypothetical protein